jgi:hypothetical protein
MIHSILTVLVLSGLLTVANQSATEAPSGVAPGRVAVTNKAGQSNDMKNDVPRRELQLAQTRPGQSTSSPSSAQQGLGTVYVVPQSVVIRDGLGGKSVAKVTQGTPLTVLADDRLQLQVRTPAGEVGYIPKRQVQAAPPATGGRDVGGLIREDRSAQELRTAASMRGLSEEAKDMARSEGISEEAIVAAESFEKFALSISDAEVDAFLTQGGLNP